jgi:hypothetical protein
MLETAYVITWRHSDGSGSGATAAFTSKDRADVLLKILQQDGMLSYKLEAVPFDSAPGVKTSATSDHGPGE